MTPRLPGEARKNRNQAQDRGTWLALLMVIGGVAGFIGLVSMIMPDFARLLTVVAGFFFFVFLHYFTWGRWLSNKVHAMEQEDDEQDD